MKKIVATVFEEKITTFFNTPELSISSVICLFGN